MNFDNLRVRLGEQEYELVPTPIALREISRNFGGIAQAMAKLSLMDSEAILFMLKMAVGNKTLATFEQDAFAFGHTLIAARLMIYLNQLTNGGKITLSLLAGMVREGNIPPEIAEQALGIDSLGDEMRKAGMLDDGGGDGSGEGLPRP